jgi:hypothetical protein
MTSRAGTRFAAFSCVALLTATTACQKDRVDESGAGESGASRPIAVQTTRHVGRPIALGSWSPRTEGLVGIDLVQVRKSPVGSLVDDWLRSASLAAGCGDDTIERTRQVLVVTNSEDKGEPLYVLHGVSRQRSKGCTVHASAWLDDDTLVLAPRWEQATLDAELAATDQHTNPRILAAVSHVDTSAALWLVAAPADPKGWSQDFTELRGTINLDRGLRASFGLKFANQDSAASAATTFEQSVKEMPPFSQYFEVARGYADGQWLNAELVISAAKLEELSRDPIFAGLFPTPQNSRATGSSSTRRPPAPVAGRSRGRPTLSVSGHRPAPRTLPAARRTVPTGTRRAARHADGRKEMVF